MNKPIPLWVFVLVVIVGLNAIVAFGWAVRHVEGGYSRLGQFGGIVISIASYPSLVKEALYETGLIKHKIVETTIHNELPPQVIINNFPEIAESSTRWESGAMGAETACWEGGKEGRWVAGKNSADDELQNSIRVIADYGKSFMSVEYCTN